MTSPLSPSFWYRKTSWALLGFLAIAAYFLLTEHAAHVVPFLPWLLLLACPLMHVFMHHGHGGHGGHHDGGGSSQPRSEDKP